MNHRTWGAHRIYARQRTDIRRYDRSMAAGLTPLTYHSQAPPYTSNGGDQALLIVALTVAGIFLLSR